MANPFFSGRIPPDLLERVEKHCAETGESKTDILISALAAYFNHPVGPRNNPAIEISKQMFAALEERVAMLENLLKSNQRTVINADNSKENPKLEEIHKQLVISIDNNSEVCGSNQVKAIEFSSISDNFDNENRDIVIIPNPISTENTPDNKLDNNSSSEEVQEFVKAFNEVEDRKQVTNTASSTESSQLPPKFELLTSAELRRITTMTQPQVDGHKRKVNQKYKNLGQTLDERKILEVPEKIENRKPITVEGYPYDLFYAGQNQKGKDLWSLITVDNVNYQQLSGQAKICDNSHYHFNNKEIVIQQIDND